MASLDVFHQDPFTAIQLTAAVERNPYQPIGIGELDLFEEEPIYTDAIMVEDRQGILALVETSARGSAPTERTTEIRRARRFDTVRLAQGDTIKASEVQNIRAFGQETELMQVEKEVARRLSGPTGLLAKLEYTKEFHRLGAIQGLLLDANGSVIENWFEQFGYAQPSPVQFDLAAGAGATPTAGVLRPICNNVVRTMARKAKGAFTPQTEVYAMCGDEFWDALTNHIDVRQTFYNWAAATELRKGSAFEAMKFGGINWFNYRGSDSANAPAWVANTVYGLGDYVTNGGNTYEAVVGGTSAANGGPSGTGQTIQDNTVMWSYVVPINISTASCAFFPRYAPGVFKVAYSPLESIEFVNTRGKPVYVLPIMDRDRKFWWRMEVYSYPLHICTRPEVLQRGAA